MFKVINRKFKNRATLGDRLETEDLSEIVRNVGNSKEMIFSTRKVGILAEFLVFFNF